MISKKNYVHNSKTIALFFVICLFSLGFLSQLWLSTQASLTDYFAHALPSLAPPPKGGSYNDPVFGTKIIRLTDSSDGGTANVAYSYWPVFNSNSTRIFIALDYNPTLYNFDPVALTFQKQGSMFTCGCATMQREGMSWSTTDPDTIYGISGYNSNTLLRAYNVATKQFTFVHDFTAAGELPAGSPAQMSKARANDQFFSFHWRPADVNGVQQPVKYAVVYDKVLNKTYLFDVQSSSAAISNFDECRLDREGNYLVISTGKEFHIWKFATQTPAQQVIVTYNGTQRAGGHGDFGSGLHVHSDLWGNNGNRLIQRSLAAPQSWSQTFDSKVTDWISDQHVSLLGPDDTWALVSTETKPADYSKPFTNEVFLAKTDGSGQVVRLLHPRSSNSTYEVSPFANLSPDGRFAAYESDWSGHCDVYIAVLPAGLWTPTTPLGSPTIQEIVTPINGVAPLAISFSGIGSSTPNGSITSYNWNFGDGATASGLTVSHTYATGGNYNATLTITDSAQQTAAKSQVINIVSGSTPIARTVATPTMGSAPLNTAFDASSSTTPNGSITNYSWNFGDNSTGTGKTITHTYQTVGNYTATLTVTDTLNKTATTTLAISVISGSATKTITLVNGDGKISSQTYDTSVLTTSPNYTIDTTFDSRVGGASGAITLMAMPKLFGTGADQIPLGAQIVSAQLTLSIYSSQATSITAARILDPDNKGIWYTGASVSNNNVGVAYSQRDAHTNVQKKWSNTATNITQVLSPDATLALSGNELSGSQVKLNVTASVAAWAAGAANQGWAIRTSTATTNPIYVYDSQNLATKRPTLTIQYITH